MSDYKNRDERDTMMVMMMLMINVRVSVRKRERKREREKNIQSKVKFNKNLKGAHTAIETYKESNVRNFNGARCGQCLLGRTRKNLHFLINQTQIPDKWRCETKSLLEEKCKQF